MNDKLVVEAKERDKTYQLENKSCFIEIECDTEDGYAYKLHIEKGGVKEYVLLDKTDVGLECVLTSSILNTEGSYKVQIEKVSDDYRMVSNAVRFHVGDFINAEHIPTPEEQDIIDELIIKIQRVEDRVDNAEDNITELVRSVETLGETKVDKEDGKGLSSNDFTTLEKNKLAALENYDDTEVREMISDEIADRQLSENILSSAITSEGNARKSAVSSLNNAIANETSARKSADTTINNRIAAEENARKQSFNSLDSRLIILSSEIPKKTSQLTNDSGFVTGSVVRTVNHTAPDENGNVDVQSGTGDVSKAYVDEQDNLIRTDVQALDDKIKDLELFKFPNATIVGEPIIDNGQVSGFSSANYLQFPFIVDVRNRPFEIDVCFTTGSDVTTQQNILDSQFGLALAIMNGKGIMAMSSNGTTWDIGQATGVVSIASNTTYYAKISWDGSVYKTSISTDGTTYVDDMSLTDSRGLFPKTIFIGGSYGLFGAGTDHPFKGTINLNNCKLSIDGLVVWVGMDDAGLATRADVSLSNIDADGIQKIKDIAGGEGGSLPILICGINGYDNRNNNISQPPLDFYFVMPSGVYEYMSYVGQTLYAMSLDHRADVSTFQLCALKLTDGRFDLENVTLIEEITVTGWGNKLIHLKNPYEFKDNEHIAFKGNLTFTHGDYGQRGYWFTNADGSYNVNSHLSLSMNYYFGRPNPTAGVTKDYVDSENARQDEEITAINDTLLQVTETYGEGVTAVDLVARQGGGGGAVDDVQINGISILDENKVANIPVAQRTVPGTPVGNYGLVAFSNYRGVRPADDGAIEVLESSITTINNRNSVRVNPNAGFISPVNLDYAVKTAMCDGKGAEWTDEEKASAQKRIGVGGKFELIEKFKVAEDTLVVSREVEPNGNPYKFSHIYIEFKSAGLYTENNFVLALNINKGDGTTSYLSKNVLQRGSLTKTSGGNCFAVFKADCEYGFISSELKTYSSWNEQDVSKRSSLMHFEADYIDLVALSAYDATNYSKIKAGTEITIYGVRA